MDATTSYGLRLGHSALFGKLIKSTFQQIHPHGYILSDSSVVTIFVPRLFLSTVLRHLILGRCPMYQVGSIRDTS
jgi:hypothetical protein